MIKIDQNYTDYRDDTDPKYPGGKAVNATTAESTDGTPLLADWMNDVNGALQALFLEAFGDINKVSGKPDNVQESDVLKAIKEIIKKSLPNSASQGDPSDTNLTQGVGLVKTVNRKPDTQECQKNEPWAASPNWVYNLLTGNARDDVNKAVTTALKDRLVSWTASQGDGTDEHPERGVGLVKTVNGTPNAQECQKNAPWAASPNWVYNLLTGNASDDVNNAVAAVMRKWGGGGVRRIDFSNETGFVEWDNGFKIESVSIPIDTSWKHTENRVFYFPIAFQTKPIFISCSIRGTSFEGVVSNHLELRSLDTTKFSVGVHYADSGMYKKGCLLVMGV